MPAARTWMPSSFASCTSHVVEDGAVDAVDGDPVRAAEHGDVADLDVVVRDNDPAADDRTRLALQDLALPDHERPLVYAGGERHDRRQPHVPRRGGADEREQDSSRSSRADAAELSAVLCVTEPKQREAGLSEDERREPACSEECERRHQRRVQAEAVDDRHQRGELDRPERHRGPGRLVREQPVPDLEIEEEPDGRHQCDELDRPPAMERSRERARGEQHHEKRCQRGSRPVPSACTTRLDPPQESVRGVARAREGVGSGERPLRGRPRDRESPCRRRSAPARSSPDRARASRPPSRGRARRRGARAAGRAESRAGIPSRRSPGRCRSPIAPRGTGPLESRARAARPTERRPDRTAPSARGDARPARAGRGSGSRRAPGGRSTGAGHSAVAASARGGAPTRLRRLPRARSATPSPRRGRRRRP